MAAFGAHQLNSGADILQLARKIIRQHDDKLKDINTKIWSNPELSYKEYLAHDNICDMFEQMSMQGYKVTRHAFGIETSFQVEYGGGGRVVVFNAEYDALPGIGHACGHNLIATSSIAAFIATCQALKDAGNMSARVRLLGTPAEESGGGKIRLLEAGAYSDVNACLMSHPTTISQEMDDVVDGFASSSPGAMLANDKVEVTFKGRPAHASVSAWEGLNALDAAVAAYVNISMLRQQIRPGERIHGVITNGGARPGVIPEIAAMEYYTRAENTKVLKELTAKVVLCFEAAAQSTGCSVEYKWYTGYVDVRTNKPIGNAYVAYMNALGRKYTYDDSGLRKAKSGGSTDMGNVSYACPGFHGMFGIPTKSALHTHEFADAARTNEAYERCLDCATGMAAVAYDILTNGDMARRVQQDFDEDVQIG